MPTIAGVTRSVRCARQKFSCTEVWPDVAVTAMQKRLDRFFCAGAMARGLSRESPADCVSTVLSAHGRDEVRFEAAFRSNVQQIAAQSLGILRAIRDT
jgi:hypothetical protein